MPGLTPPELEQIGLNELLLDDRTRDYIQEKFTYRYVTRRDGLEAIALEKEIQQKGINRKLPKLNPAKNRKKRKNRKKDKDQ